MDDAVLMECNESELLEMARVQGLGHIRRGLPKKTLVDLVSGRENPSPEHLAGTEYTRRKLQTFIYQHWDVVRSQLPGCDGKCTTFPCSEARHAMCFEPNKQNVQ